MRIKVERKQHAGLGQSESGVVGVDVIQITPQMRILVAIEAVDGRKYAPSTNMRSCWNRDCERAALLHQKTRKGAQMGDLSMSLIHTCELNGVNAFNYLTELQRHAEELKRNPSKWMPWNYRETLTRLAMPAAA